ncbi:MAG: response regulator [Deltaproteobacteria bacterium]|nr:response regulator [Deltaproteobacteria bacterium]
MAGNFIKPRILIADDNFVIRDLIKSFYEDYNFELIEAVNGQEAVEMVRTCIFDLILLDIQMPLLNGYEVAAILKNDKDVKDIPIVVITSHEHGEVEDRINGLYEGYVNKPFKKSHLMKATMKYLQRSIHKDRETQKGTV